MWMRLAVLQLNQLRLQGESYEFLVRLGYASAIINQTGNRSLCTYIEVFDLMQDTLKTSAFFILIYIEIILVILISLVALQKLLLQHQ